MTLVGVSVSGILGGDASHGVGCPGLLGRFLDRGSNERKALGLFGGVLMTEWGIDHNGDLARIHHATDHVAYFDEERDGGLLCLFCADSAYGALVQEMAPVRVGELLGSDTPDPSTWTCCECENNVLTYL